MTDSYRLGSDGVYRCDALQQFVWQQHGFGTRHGNPAVGITLRQVHSARVWNANVLNDREREGDALITDCAGKSIGIRTADCVPVLMLDCKKRAVAAVHAGWRGTAAGIVQRAIEKLREDFDTDVTDLYVAIGPCIRECCYQVGPEVAEQFAQTFREWAPSPPGKRNLDLVEANCRQLQAAGVNSGLIFDCGLCTACLADQFISFRREPENSGRMVSSIGRLA